MRKPTLHMNGTSGQALLEQVEGVLSALRKLQEAMANATPNGRDYYVQGDGAAGEAIAEHDARRMKLCDLVVDYTALADSVVDQMQARKR